MTLNSIFLGEIAYAVCACVSVSNRTIYKGALLAHTVQSIA